MNARIASVCAATFLCAISLGTHAADASLRLGLRIDLPGYTGDFDHFEYDFKTRRLWLAAEDHGTVDVLDLTTGKRLHSIRGVVTTPHGILYVPSSNRLLVTDSGGSVSTRLIDASTRRLLGGVTLPAPKADAIGYDASARRLYIVNGGRDAGMEQTYLSVVDPVTLERLGDVSFDSDKVEAMAIEQSGNRLYINLTGRNEVAVLDKNTLQRIATWPMRQAQQNAVMALDEPNRRLFVVTRKPSRLMVLDTDTGATVATFHAPDRCDQLIWDAGHRRIYALGGEGYIGVFEQKSADQYDELARVASAAGAKTGILVPELHRLYVAVSPGQSRSRAAILIFDVAAATD